MQAKLQYTLEETKELLASLETVYDYVRLVDPFERRVALPENEKSICCGDVWARDERCDDCISLRAAKEKKRLFKLELSGNESFFVTSKYIEVDGKPMALELIQNTTESFTAAGQDRDRLQKAIKAHTTALFTDSLTGLLNRRFLDEKLLPSIEKEHSPFAMAFLDIDRFKLINDDMGHLAGDSVLKALGAHLKDYFNVSLTNTNRLAIRYGGDEFIVIARDADIRELESEMKQMEAELKSDVIEKDGHPPFTISVGYAAFNGRDTFSFSQVFETAEKEMYKTKKLKGVER
jgi:diguanylate cyclase (GGDEF) domain